MLNVEFYGVGNEWSSARDFMPCLWRDFCDFHKSLPLFLTIFCRDFLLSLQTKQRNDEQTASVKKAVHI